jgi:hypothetical protein
MNYWTWRRKASLVIHAAFVSVPFTISTVSALLFWYTMFGGWELAVAMVAVVEVLALTGLVLYVARVPSPFQALRHVLPFISIVPLGLELHGLLARNGPAIALSLTMVATAILIAIAWQCFRTIERLFVDPVTAAREKAHEQVSGIARTLAQLDEMNAVVGGFVRDYTGTVTVIDSAPDSATLSKTQQVKQIASDTGVSESTVWRKVRSGTIKLTEEA